MLRWREQEDDLWVTEEGYLVRRTTGVAKVTFHGTHYTAFTPAGRYLGSRSSLESAQDLAQEHARQAA